jgi:hypothetical protein
MLVTQAVNALGYFIIAPTRHVSAGIRISAACVVGGHFTKEFPRHFYNLRRYRTKEPASGCEEINQHCREINIRRERRLGIPATQG